jgi:YD repeat-containing protein
MTMSWTGRELQSISKNNNTYSFTYNLNGLRTKKSVNGTNTFYYYDDSNNLIGLKKGNTTVLFYYDQNGQVYSMTLGSNTYFFIKNLQGDVIKRIHLTNRQQKMLPVYLFSKVFFSITYLTRKRAGHN